MLKGTTPSDDFRKGAIPHFSHCNCAHVYASKRRHHGKYDAIFHFNFLFSTHCNFPCEGHHFCGWSRVIFWNLFRVEFWGRGLVRFFLVCTRSGGSGDVMTFLAWAHMADATPACCWSTFAHVPDVTQDMGLGMWWRSLREQDANPGFWNHTLNIAACGSLCLVWSCLTLNTNSNRFVSYMKGLYAWLWVSNHVRKPGREMWHRHQSFDGYRIWIFTLGPW